MSDKQNEHTRNIQKKLLGLTRDQRSFSVRPLAPKKYGECAFILDAWRFQPTEGCHEAYATTFP